MSASWLYLIGTLALWLGMAGFAHTLWLMARQFTTPGAKTPKGGIVAGMTIFGLGLIIHGSLPMNPDPNVVAQQGFALPLTWVLMNAGGWLFVLSIVVVFVRAIQYMLDSSRTIKRTKLVQIGCWTLAALLGWSYFTYSGQEVTVFRGVAYLSNSSIIGTIALLAAGMFFVAWTSKNAQTTNWLKGAAKHFVLVIGSIVFSIPLFWLLLTSVKEDKDTSFSDEMHWIPRVMVTVPFSDPQNPYYEAQYEGKTVSAFQQKLLPGDKVQLRIDRPIGIRGLLFVESRSRLKAVPQDVPLVTTIVNGKETEALVAENLPDGRQRLVATGGETSFLANPGDTKPVWRNGPRWANYAESTEYMPPETMGGFAYLKNTLILVVLCVIGTVLSCSLVAYGFSRLRFVGKGVWYAILLATMMLPGAVTLLPTFLVFRWLGWIDTLLPLWVPAFFAGAFNVFLLRQFFSGIPTELEDAAKIDGCGFLQTYWRVMMPQIGPAITVVGIWTFMGTWNNFMGPLIYISSPEKMPISYALQLFQSDHSAEPTLLMAFATMAMLPVLAVFFAAQKYFIEGVSLSGFGGR